MTSRASRPWKSDLIEIGLNFVEIALIFAVFFVQGASPVPDVNEPYYLGKAIHFWNPDWVQGDFFLDSADAHWAFYFAFGWLSLVVSPPVLAWIGRLLTWGLLAWSWHRLSWALAPRRGMALLSAALFACLMERCHMAGEWVIGGVEAKGFAYVLVFLGLEAMVRDRWNRAWLLFGAASLLHVVVGGWVVVAAGFAWLVSGPSSNRPLQPMWPGLLGGLLISLPSVIPLLALNWGVDAATAASAHWIYVYYRLPHHLIASEFRWDFLLRFEAMVVVWAILCRAIREYEYDPLREIEDHQLLRGFIVGALAIALAGAALSALVSDHPALAARLLRFYWFRLSDVAVPLGVALFGVCWILQLWREGEGYNTGGSWTWSPSPRGPSAALRGPYSSGSSWKYVFFAMPSRSRGLMGWLVLVAAATAAVWHVADFVRLRIQVASGVKPAIPRADLKVDKLGGYAAWREACEWIATSGVIPAHARFLTPIDGQTFKWLTRRAEVVSRKDVPQDAASIVVWWERLRDIHGIGADEPRRYWHTSLAELPVERLRELGAKYGAAYILTEAPGVRLPEVELPETGISPPKPAPRLNLKELHSNSGYIIYAIAPP